MHSPAQREGKGGPRKWPCRRHKEQPVHTEAGVPFTPGSRANRQAESWIQRPPSQPSPAQLFWRAVSRDQEEALKLCAESEDRQARLSPFHKGSKCPPSWDLGHFHGAAILFLPPQRRSQRLSHHTLADFLGLWPQERRQRSHEGHALEAQENSVLIYYFYLLLICSSKERGKWPNILDLCLSFQGPSAVEWPGVWWSSTRWHVAVFFISLELIRYKYM